MVAVLVLLMAQLVSSAIVKPETRLQPSLEAVLPGVQWCNYKYYCPSCTSCCLRSDGTFGCCGNDMVCCPDGWHCCPYGSRCDATSTRCQYGGSGGLSLPSTPQQAAAMIDTTKLQVFPKEPESPSSALKPSVQWCDFTTYCPDCTTCCRNKAGTWSCCVFSNGQCCADGVHCCAYGYRCDSTSNRCVVGGMSIPSSPQHPAIVANHSMLRDIEEEKKQADSKESTPRVPVQQALETDEMDAEIVRCDARYGCPSGSTCCKTLNGEWGCCPFSEGQCCEDGKHCCESGYECDGSVSCKKGSLNVPAGLKEAPLTL